MVSVIAIAKNTFWELDIAIDPPEARPRCCSDGAVDYRSFNRMEKGDAGDTLIDTDDETLTPHSWSTASESDSTDRWSDLEDTETGMFPPGAWSPVLSTPMLVPVAAPMALHATMPVFPAFGAASDSAWNHQTTSVAAAVAVRMLALGGSTFAELARAGTDAEKRSEVAEQRAQKRRAPQKVRRVRT